MTINPDSFLVAPNEGDSYWFGVDLFTFKAVGENTRQKYVLFEALIQPQSGTPPHIHSREDESFYVQEGEFEFQLDREIITATTGTFLYSPKNQLHGFTNIGSTTAKLLIWLTPAGFEKFISEVGVAATSQIAPASLNPEDLERIITVGREYGIEILPPNSESA